MALTQEQQGNEQLKPEEIVVPKDTAMALGRGLNQLLSQLLEEIKPYIDNLGKNPQVDQSYVEAMRQAINRTLAIPDNFEHAKEIKIVPLLGGFDFAFSEERATEEQPPIKSEITIDETTIPRLSHLTDAMQHNFNNSLIPLNVHPVLIEKSTNDPTVKQQAAEIASRYQSMLSALNPIQTEDHQLKILTDATGSTTITPTQRSLAGQKTQ